MSENQKISKSTWVIIIVISVVVFLAGLFTASVIERRGESVARLQPIKDLPEWEPRNEEWGKNYPRQFESYIRMLDTNFRSKHGGSATIDYLDEFPELVILWAGYAFSKDYNQGRGHAYAITDIRNTLRTGGATEHTQPATCWSCKSTDVPRMMAKLGAEEFYKKKWFETGAEIINPIGCQDCHDPKSMNLRITRPALIEALERRGKKMADVTHQEMRSLVCAQCHVEYYFKGDGKYLTFPWDKGFSADSMEAYYDEMGYKDYSHKLSKTPVLKAQHPDYELFMTGIHAKRGVSCADCHMPYKVEGGVKYTDHHIQSPLNNVSNACQICHKESEQTLMNDVYDRQDRVLEIRRILEKSLSAAHLEAEFAWKNSATEEEMAPALKLIRSAQWRWDWVAAANGVGFHSPVEALRVLGTGIEKAEKARGIMNSIFARYNIKLPVPLADVNTKEKAQKYIGLDMQKLKDDKKEFLNRILPEWEKQAKQRQGTLYKY
jgi:nitrite reductase (cytochrome c-552)